MKNNFFPLCVVTAVPTKTGIRFLHPRTQYDIDNFTEEIWALLAECNGYQMAEAITKKLDRFGTDVIRSIMDELTEIGVLVESREIAKHFHQFSNNPMLHSQNLSFSDVAEYTSRPPMPIFEGTEFAFPNAESHLKNVLASRQSVRNFSREQLSITELGGILSSSYLLKGSVAPSAGGLYPLKLYVIVAHQGVMPQGYYEYDPANQALVLYNTEIDREELEFALNTDDLLFGAGAILVIAADLQRHIGKYSSRGYRYTLLEAGHVAQNVHIVCTELGLGCLEYGGFQDDVLSEELGFKELGIDPLIVVAIGRKSVEPYETTQSVLMRLHNQLVGPRKPVRYVHVTGGDQTTKGDSFFAASALHAPNLQQDARRSYGQRFVGGTGTSSNIAQIKAVAEAFERYASGMLRNDIRSAANQLPGPWLDPRKIAPLTPEQMKAHQNLQKFSESDIYEWVEGAFLKNGGAVFVPIDLVFYPVFAESLGRQPLHMGNSSGVAAHTSLEEAQRRALLEAIERDALMHLWFSRRPPVQIAHKNLPHHWRRRAAYWRDRGREVHVFDISRHGVSVTQVAIVSKDAYPSFVTGASASGISFEESVTKAFHEAELVLLHMLKSKETKPIDPKNVFHPMDHARLYAHPEHLDNLEWIWAGEVTDTATIVCKTDEMLFNELDAVSVTLSPQDAPLFVIRVLSEKLVPINFGYGSEYYTHPSLEGLIHPDSLKLPHFFA